MSPTCPAPADLPVGDGLTSAPPDPELIAWPADELQRVERRRLGLPTILVLDAAHDPPREWGDLEDWVRLPIDPDELAARIERVQLMHQLATDARPTEVVAAAR